MTGLHLVTGYNGTAHITSADQGLFNAVSVGAGEYVFTHGRQFEAQIISNNAVRIYDGALMMNGRYVTLPSGSYLDAIIANGTSGMKRHDIIGIRYEMNTTNGIESVSLVVGQGTASASAPTDPTNSYTNSILNGVTVHDMWLYRVVLNGLSIEKVEPLFTLMPPMSDLCKGFYKQNLLINGDFQCNQRGSKAYDTTDTVAYTVDMWRGHQVKVDVLNEGVKLTGSSDDVQGYFTQFIQLGKLKTTTYTIAAMADDQLCKFTVTPGGTAKSKDFGKFTISALTTSTWDNELNDYNNKLKINICPLGTSSITFQYIDVFEGVVAYPHVKEDPATAMMRCRRYIQSSGYTAPILTRTITANSDGLGHSYEFGIPIENMASKEPNLEYCSWSYQNLAEDGVISGNVDDLVYKGVSVGTPSGKLMRVRTPGSTEVDTRKNEYCHAIKGVYILSCEHNPNGD